MNCCRKFNEKFSIVQDRDSTGHFAIFLLLCMKSSYLCCRADKKECKSHFFQNRVFYINKSSKKRSWKNIFFELEMGFIAQTNRVQVTEL